MTKKNRSKNSVSRVIAALDAHQWLITDEALANIYEIATRANDLEAFKAAHTPFDIETLLTGHEGRLKGSRGALVSGDRAIIPIIGPIFPRANLMTEYSGATSISNVASDTEIAVRSGLKPLLYISTPGGVVEGISEYAQMVARLNIDAMVSGQCTSAGYWIASQCNSITVADTAVIGNIGAKGPNPKVGDDDSLVSQHAPNKKATPAMIKGVLNQIETVFIQAVADGRDVTPDHVIAHYGQGGVFVGQQAVDAGLADRIGTLESYLNDSQPARAITTGTISMDPKKIGDMTLADHEAAIKALNLKAEQEKTSAIVKAAADERARISAIMEAGEDKPISAKNIAFDTDMTVEQATAFLEKQPTEKTTSGNDPLASAMGDVTNPAVGDEGDPDAVNEVAAIDSGWDQGFKAVGAA